MTVHLESDDGIRWRRRALGLIEVKGSRDNPCVLAGTRMCSHNFTPFVDQNPAARRAARYKALGGVGDHIEGVVTWRGDADLSRRAGKSVWLRVVLEDADLFSLRFREAVVRPDPTPSTNAERPRP